MEHGTLTQAAMTPAWAKTCTHGGQGQRHTILSAPGHPDPGRSDPSGPEVAHMVGSVNSRYLECPGTLTQAAQIASAAPRNKTWWRVRVNSLHVECPRAP
jgi:hypothetical protein